MAYLDENGLEHFWGKIKDRVSSAVAPKANDADVVHKTGDETVGGVKTFQNSRVLSAAGTTGTDIVIRNPEVSRGTPLESERSYTRVVFADAEGNTEETQAGRLGLIEIASPKENDTIGSQMLLGCYKYSSDPADYTKRSQIIVGYDNNGIPYAIAPATSNARTASTDVVTRGYMEASEWNWQKTKETGAVAFKPVPESDLESVVDFMFTETPPAEGEKGPENPSIVTGVSSVNVTRCGKNIIKFPYYNTTTINDVSFTVNSDGSVIVSGTASADTSFFLATGLLLKKETDYFLSGCPSGGSVSTYYLAVSGGVYDAGTGNIAHKTDDTLVAVWIKICSGVTISTPIVFRPQLELGSAATPFELYSGTDYTIQLGDTYYGGTLNVATGVMTVTWVAVELNGTEHWDVISIYNSTTGIGLTRCYPEYLGLLKKAALDVTSNSACTHFSYLGNFGVIDISDGTVTTPRFFYTNGTASVDGHARFAVPYSDIADFKAWLAEQKTAGTPVMLTYKIYEPFTVQLTPTQIRSLPALDKYEPRINTVYTDQEAVQVGYQRFYDENRLAAIEARLDALEGN